MAVENIITEVENCCCVRKIGVSSTDYVITNELKDNGSHYTLTEILDPAIMVEYYDTEEDPETLAFSYILPSKRPFICP